MFMCLMTLAIGAQLSSITSFTYYESFLIPVFHVEHWVQIL